MLMDYPGLIMKFTLLVQAGLTARKSVPENSTGLRKERRW